MTGCVAGMAAGSVREKTVSAGVRLGERVQGAKGMLVKSASDFEYERRMNNWRMWRLSERRAFGGSPYPVYNLTPRPPRGENVIPILAGEAEETERAIGGLPVELRRAVEIWFLRSGSVNEKRKMLRCRRERLFALLEEARTRIVQRVWR